MTTLVKPHGADELKPLLLEGDALAAEQARARNLPKVNVSSREAGDLRESGINRPDHALAVSKHDAIGGMFEDLCRRT